MGRTAGIWPYVCLVPALAVFIMLEIVPALGTSIFSLTDYTGLPHAAINWVGLQNYHDLLTGGQTFLVRALQVTAIFSLLVTIIQEHLCDDCHQRVADEYDRVIRYHRDLDAQVDW